MSQQQKTPISNHSTDLGGNTTLDASMKLENFLLEEYKHTGAFLLQTMQDLTASVNLYFVLVGVLVSGLGLAYNSGIILQPSVVPVLMIFLLVFGVIHFFFFARFISFAIVYRAAVERMTSLRTS